MSQQTAAQRNRVRRSGLVAAPRLVRGRRRVANPPRVQSRLITSRRSHGTVDTRETCFHQSKQSSPSSTSRCKWRAANQNDLLPWRRRTRSSRSSTGAERCEIDCTLTQRAHLEREEVSMMRYVRTNEPTENRTPGLLVVDGGIGSFHGLSGSCNY